MGNKKRIKKGPQTSLSKKYRGKPKRRGKSRGKQLTKKATREKKPDADAEPCIVQGCRKKAVRSLSRQKYERFLKRLNWSLKDDESRRLHVCKAHYKDLKKEYKKDYKIVGPKFAGGVAKKNPRGFKNLKF